MGRNQQERKLGFGLVFSESERPGVTLAKISLSPSPPPPPSPHTNIKEIFLLLSLFLEEQIE